MLARRFLYVLAALIFLMVGAGLIWSLFPEALMRWTFVPSVAFEAPPPAPDYAKADSWLSRPGTPNDPALRLPPGMERPPAGPAVIFFVSPTSYFDKRHWNASYDDKEADVKAHMIVSSQASAFSGVGHVWAPRYRQATVGAFLAISPESSQALNVAYGDVERAFAAFLTQAPADAPIILAAHSQGSVHLLRLIREHVVGTSLEKRIVAVYAVGWPVSMTADLPALGMPACTRADQTGCLLSWESFAEPANTMQLRTLYDATVGFTGALRKGTPALCVNPITGTQNGAAPATANLGALVPDAGYHGATLEAGLIPARCDSGGLLLIGEAPTSFGVAVLPGNNFHAFDYALFWANVRADAARRLAAFRPAR